MRKVTVLKILLAVVLLVPSLSPANASARKITVSGDPCTVPLAKRVGEAFTKKTGVEVEVLSGKCRSGVSEVLDGKADVGLATFNFDPATLDKSLTDQVAGKAPIVIVVNKKNPVNDLSLAQLKGILAGRIRNWKEAGGNDAEIKNVLLQPCVVETMSYQAEHYGHDINRLKPDVPGNPVTGTNLLVEKDADALGLQLYGHESADVKVVSIDGYLPDEKAFPAHYAFYEDYNIVTKTEPDRETKAFVEFFLGEDGQRILASMKHIPRSRMK